MVYLRRGEGGPPSSSPSPSQSIMGPPCHWPFPSHGTLLFLYKNHRPISCFHTHRWSDYSFALMDLVDRYYPHLLAATTTQLEFGLMSVLFLFYEDSSTTFSRGLGRTLQHLPRTMWWLFVTLVLSKGTLILSNRNSSKRNPSARGDYGQRNGVETERREALFQRPGRASDWQ